MTLTFIFTEINEIAKYLFIKYLLETLLLNIEFGNIVYEKTYIIEYLQRIRVKYVLMDRNFIVWSDGLHIHEFFFRYDDVVFV